MKPDLNKQSHNNRISYAFIVHSRDRADLPRKYPILRYLPNWLFDFLTLSLRPIIVSKIIGLKNRAGMDVDGLIIGIPMTARQLLENRSLATKRIIQAVELGKKRGAKYFGLGAMTGSLSKGGLDVVERVERVYVSTGRSYTIKNIIDYVDWCVDKFEMNPSKIRVGIIGAAGGIGSGVAVLLAISGFKKLTLIDIDKKSDMLRQHIIRLQQHSSDLNVDISHRVTNIQNCHIVIAATSAPEVVIRSADVQSGTILINDAQPSDISPEIIENRKDVLVIEGGVLHAPSIDCRFNLGLATKNDIFSCLAETLIMTYRLADKHHSLGNFSLELIDELKVDANKLGFRISIPQNTLGYISEKQIQEFATIMKLRQLKN